MSAEREDAGVGGDVVDDGTDSDESRLVRDVLYALRV